MFIECKVDNIYEVLKNNFYNEIKLLDELRVGNKTVALCHGCFDPLHIGHVYHFQEAKKIADILVVTITPDQYITKGENRPYFNMNQRLTMVRELRTVDLAIINLWPTAINTIKEIQPNYFVKGIDYKDSIMPNYLAEKEALESLGGKMLITDTKKYSSTVLLNQGLFR